MEGGEQLEEAALADFDTFVGIVPADKRDVVKSLQK